MSAVNQKEVVTIRLPRTYDVELLKRDLQTLRDVQGAPQPGPYHAASGRALRCTRWAARIRFFPAPPAWTATKRQTT